MDDARKIIGRPVDGGPDDEASHYIACPACGRWLDMRELGDVLQHEATCGIEPPPFTN